MDQMTIRQATRDDAAAISALIRHTVRRSNAVDYSPEVIELIVANFTADKVTERMAARDVYICQIGRRIVGTVSLAGDRLHSMFVDPDAQRTGIGSQLVAHLEAHARKSSVRDIRLSSSLTARDFYEKLGYRVLGFEERDDGSTFRMAKTL
ncbi:hypothetical protein BH11PSE3_BH11PSE3_08380 [soil metagenome]